MTVAEERALTRWDQAVFRAKVRAHQVRRLLRDLLAGPVALKRAAADGFGLALGASRTLLMSDRRQEERAYQHGKIANLRRAALSLNGLVVPAEAVFSFWRHVGPPASARGFVVGRMLQEGCLVPAVGGGLCQLSNALFDAALQSGCEIVERHAHSRRVPGSAAAFGRDATVAWNYVDLRFRPPRALRIGVAVTDDHLEVTFTGRTEDGPPAPPTVAPAPDPAAPAFAESCATCGDAGCFRHEGGRGPPRP